VLRPLIDVTDNPATCWGDRDVMIEVIVGAPVQ
jgi:hypothetical protein